MLQLGDRHGIGRVGFGGAAVAGLFQDVSEAIAEQTLNRAWQAGVRLFDTAPHYGRGKSEARFGRFLSNRARESFFLSTKVGRILKPRQSPWPKGRPVDGFVNPLPFDQIFDYSYDGIMSSFEDSLKRLQTDYVDLLLVHDIGRRTHGDNHDRHWNDLLNSGLRALDELKAAGAVRKLGLGVNEWEICRDLMAVFPLDYVLLAGRGTLLDQSAILALYPECMRRNTKVLAAAPFNSGVLARGSSRIGEAHYDYGGIPDEIRQRLLTLEDVCSRYDVSLRAAALQYPLLHPAVDSVVTGFRSPEEVGDAMYSMAVTIPSGFWADLESREVLKWVPGSRHAEVLGS